MCHGVCKSIADNQQATLTKGAESVSIPRMSASKKSGSKAGDPKSDLNEAREIARSGRASNKITTSSTAEYFSKNLQQVGFSSQIKATLTTLKEAVDNALDACEEHQILPEVSVVIEKPVFSVTFDDGWSPRGQNSR